MKRDDIKNLLGESPHIQENINGTAFEITIVDNNISIIVTIPFDVHVIHYEATDKAGNSLVTDLQDFYGSTEESDFKETVLETLDLLKSPSFKLINNGKTIETNGKYLFGKSS